MNSDTFSHFNETEIVVRSSVFVGVVSMIF